MDNFGNLYSPKVLEHIKNPQNMGEIKNPDGVATVGNPSCGDIMRLFIKVEKKGDKEYLKDIKFQTLGCLPRNEEVVLPEGGWERIGEIQRFRPVLNEDGEETPVIHTYKRDYEGALLKIIPFVSPFNSFSVTPNHPILAVKRRWVKRVRKSNKGCDWLRVEKKELLEAKPDFVRADELETGDYLVFSFNRKQKNDKFLTSKMMRLLGYYLSEGYITAGTVINFSFNKKEEKLINEAKSLMYTITGKKGSQRTRGNVTEIRFCSTKWANIFVSLAGKLARHKSLSSKILLLPPKKQWEMIETYLLGDGDTYRRRQRDSETYRATTASRNLAIQFQEILARIGVFASIREIFKTDCVIEGRKLRDSIQYLISFKLKRKHRFVHKHKKYFLVPIRKIEVRNFKGLVYNFQVGLEPNSYLVRGFAVHNCGAAIATSSMITVLAKGKTLAEAEKISRQGLADAVGGLPPVKLHCSVLAADALKQAIENYRRKK